MNIKIINIYVTNINILCLFVVFTCVDFVVILVVVPTTLCYGLRSELLRHSTQSLISYWARKVSTVVGTTITIFVFSRG